MPDGPPSDALDYVAEVARTRRAQGVPVEIPQHQKDAVAALLAIAADREHERAAS